MTLGLPWFRMDCAFARNPKILAVIAERDGFRAAFVWAASIGYANEQGTDGLIPAYSLPVLHGRPRDAELLVKHRLWHNARGGGWTIHDFAQFQQSNGETQERARRLRVAGLKANCVRWHGSDCGCWQESDPDSESDG